MEAETWTNSVNQANKLALLAWARETGIDLVQVNGQRRYGGPPAGWVGDPPPPGTEVFIGKLPQDVYEDALIPLFQSVGKLYEFRLMMTFSGLNRGFAYAKYSSRRGARDAVASLNNFEVREGCAIVVRRSTEKRELSVDGLWAWLRPRELEAVLRRATPGVLRLALHASPGRRRTQLAVVTYSSHHAAAMAKKTLMEGNTRLGGAEMTVEWLNPSLKQKLQLCEEKPLPPAQGQGDKHRRVPALVPPVPGSSRQPPGALEQLNALCRRQHLGAPLFLTRCLQAHPNGWLQLWCRVVIPGCPVPFSSLTWVRQDGPDGSWHEEAKAAVALQVLRLLGFLLT
ncbi:dead end protein homolog 1 isoform X2 [Colius striatus]|uniref:dead end protein homolog 1 isoform X2 n=1 Tax=Colius striatus TaxID=57412 RepID=UPI002B1E1C87|nr:dead end protein homolog 1 isoform X2 [Colius striatus]